MLLLFYFVNRFLVKIVIPVNSLLLRLRTAETYQIFYFLYQFFKEQNGHTAKRTASYEYIFGYLVQHLLY